MAGGDKKAAKKRVWAILQREEATAREAAAAAEAANDQFPFFNHPQLGI
jgi:protein-disulfide isomerase